MLSGDVEKVPETELDTVLYISHHGVHHSKKIPGGQMQFYGAN